MAAFTKVPGGKEKELPTNVTSVYMHVVEDVIENVRADFQSDGVEDAVLIELQALWELKMRQSGAISGGAVQEPAAIPAPKSGAPQPSPNVHDLNVPYEVTDDYEAPADDMPYPPVPTVTSTGEPVMFQYMPPGPSESSILPDNGLSLNANHGRPASFMQQPAPWMKPRVVEINVNETYEERDEEENGYTQLPNSTQDSIPAIPPVTKDFFTLSTGKRKHDEMASGYVSGKYIPQQDGAGDEELSLASSVVAISSHTGIDASASWEQQRLIGRNTDGCLSQQEVQKADATIAHLVHGHGLSRLPQLDGIDDNYDDTVAEEDYNELGEEDAQQANDGTPKAAGKAEPTDSDGSEPPLNEDDDDELDDTDQGDEELKTNHLVLAQFDKVTRSKNKWKCTLKDGIMHLNNRDILFVKATGEFEF
ncbi:hypothetical protein CY35_01G120400 [Sphagnum magellanicum]|nr:hypothetical protein CY35_01G120400 [Sphagnum magellanicum]KAH9575622.1 hypothetical protein CY35_01G120400 [Sphagnum magellanicum]KAH9575623.1 hypothetical protein CY35_01G120400 [Sphagnum magellanicum]